MITSAHCRNAPVNVGSFHTFSCTSLSTMSPPPPCLNIRAWKFACGWVRNHLGDCFTWPSQRSCAYSRPARQATIARSDPNPPAFEPDPTDKAAEREIGLLGLCKILVYVLLAVFVAGDCLWGWDGGGSEDCGLVVAGPDEASFGGIVGGV